MSIADPYILTVPDPPSSPPPKSDRQARWALLSDLVGNSFTETVPASGAGTIPAGTEYVFLDTTNFAGIYTLPSVEEGHEITLFIYAGDQPIQVTGADGEGVGGDEFTTFIIDPLGDPPLRSVTLVGQGSTNNWRVKSIAA